MKNLTAAIIKAGLLVGTLDILSAFIYYFIKSGKTNFDAILKYIASALAGPAAYSGGGMMAVAGLLLHYAIAFAFTVFFFRLYPAIKFLSANRIVTGVIYGTFIWVVMNLVVVPSSKNSSASIQCGQCPDQCGYSDGMHRHSAFVYGRQFL